MMKVWLGALFLLFMAGLGYADTLHLKNGRSMEGIIKKEDSESLELEVGVNCSVKFLKSDISSISRSSQQDYPDLRAAWEKDKQEALERMAKERLAEEGRPRSVDFSHGSQGIVINALLDDRVEAKMVFDTGASIVLIARSIADKLGIDLGGSEPDLNVQVADGRSIGAKRIFINKIEVQGVYAENVEAAVLLSDAGDLGFSDGLLGMSFLKNFNFKVDQKEKKLILEKL